METLWSRIRRVIRHGWLDESDLNRVISSAMLDRLQRTVSASEQQHSGEIRICIEASLPWLILWPNVPTSQIIHARALALFAEMGVWDTAGNNGVLIYVLLAEQGIEIIADRGINARVAPDRWQTLVQQMGEALHKGLFEEGLNQGVNGVTEALRLHFPSDATQNQNELPDRPVLR